jgi:Zn finger protein HypA/HybF involved in hydrogenase expression
MRKRIPLDDILTVNSTFARHALKFRLIDEKRLEYICDECQNRGEWNGKKLSLHLDHTNSVFNDNRIENLRFLCPNCHAQTDSYAGKNIIGKKNKGTAKTDYRYLKREADKKKWDDIRNNSGIDFNKRGWVGQVADILQISPQKINKWLQRVDAEFHSAKYTGV